MSYRITYGEYIDWKSFRRLPASDKKRIRLMIEQKLEREPAVFGKPLRSPLFGVWSLRIGDYRVIYRIIGNIVLIELIGHRATIYSETENIFG